MPIFPTEPAPPDPRLAAAARIRELFQQAMNAGVAVRELNSQIWFNPDVAAQNVFDALGTDGQPTLDGIAAMKDLVEALAIANGQTLDDYLESTDYYSPPAGYSTTNNGDGTITVNGP